MFKNIKIKIKIKIRNKITITFKEVSIKESLRHYLGASSLLTKALK